MSGRLTIWIDGREALPVRAIPYVGGWQHLYSPDVVAESLARAIAAPFGKLRNIYAYHLQEGNPLRVMPNEWSAVVAEIKGFEAGLHEQRPDVDAMNDHVGYAEWRKAAALILPAGVFVWLDEFLREREVDREFTPDNVPVTLAPMLDADTRAAVLEGFEDCPRRGSDADRAMGSGNEAPKVGAGATVASTLPEGIPTGTIVQKFKLSEAWKSKLTHIKSNPFLEDALMRPGRRNKGKTRRMPHLWNPVRFAEILIKRDGRNRRAMEATITHHFASWQDVWHESMESDEADEYAA